jgi:hypothetical protein
LLKRIGSENYYQASDLISLLPNWFENAAISPLRRQSTPPSVEMTNRLRRQSTPPSVEMTNRLRRQSTPPSVEMTELGWNG